MNETVQVPKDGLLTTASNLPISFLVASAVPLIFLSLSYIISPKLDPREPLAVWPRFPLIGHIFGMIFEGFTYYRRPVKKSREPIITLPVLNGKIYVATGKEVISQIARNSKTLSFDPFVGPISAKITGASPKMMEVVTNNLGKEGNDAGYYVSITSRMKSYLAPGETLTDMEKSIFNFISLKLIEIQGKKHGAVVGLLDQVRQFFDEGTLNALYGPSYPYMQVPSFRQDLLAFEHGLDGLIMGVMPTVTARKAFYARERMVKHLVDFFRDGLPDEVNPIIRSRYEQGIRFGLSPAEIARFEVAIFLAFIENTRPGAFWMMLHIWATPGLAEELRTCLLAALEAAHPGHRPEDALPYGFLAGVGRTVPLLKGTFEEMLRVHSFSNSVRQVMADTVLSGRGRDYLVKEGHVIIIPNSVLHSNEDSFPDPAAFKPRRFRPDAGKPAEYRPWGGGGTVCPGRHFAQSETLALAAMMLLGFDVSCVDREGNAREWWFPEGYQQNQAVALFPPKEDVFVRLLPREGWNLAISFD